MNHRLFILPFLAIAVCLVSAAVGAAEDVNITLEGHLGGVTYATAVSGNYLYVGQGQDLVVLDISNPAQPSELDRIRTGDIVRGINFSGRYAYVADENDGLLIFDISNPAAPVLTGVYDTEMDAAGVAVSGSYAYVANNDDGLLVIDISNPTAPVLTGVYDTAIFAMGVTVSGSYAYVADVDNGLVIVDISNPAAPVLAGAYDTAGANGTWAWGVAVSGSYAYVADGEGGLVIVDISDPAAPTLAGDYDTGWAYGVAVSGSYAYVANGLGLVIVDISNPAAPVLVGNYSASTLGQSWGVVVSGSYAYVADILNGLVIVDISNPVAPVFADGYDMGGATQGVAVSGSYAYVADMGGLVIVDINNPATPVFAGSYDITGYAEGDDIAGYAEGDDIAGYAKGVAVSGNYAYFNAYVINAYDNSWNADFVVIDVTNPAAPTFAGSYDTPGYGQDVVVSGSYAYVADSENGLVIIDISNPAVPTLAGSYDTVGGRARDVVVSGSYAYVAGGEGGLVIVDISNPAAPVFAGSYDTAGYAVGVAISGSYAYVNKVDYNSWSADLMVIDVSNPAAPVLAGSYDTGYDYAGYADGVAISGSYAYVADQNEGLLVIDINNPAAPVLAGSYDTAGTALGVAVSGNYAYVADDANGLVILRTDASGTTTPVHNINKGTDYTTIQSAIDAASTGDEIHVDSGTYYENVDVTKQLTLRGIDTGAGMPVVDAGGSGNAITLSTDGIRLEGFMATNAGSAGSDPNAGIMVMSSFNVLIGNTASNNNASGICLWGFERGYDGELESRNYNTLIGNTASNNNYGILLEFSNDNTFIGNTASNNNNGDGIYLMISHGNTLSGNTASNNNNGDGIYLHESWANTLIGNTASNNNGAGILLEYSGNNMLYHNNLDNTNNAYDGDEFNDNQWDSGSEGNYYSDYLGIDSDSDGIGDTPYPIPGGSVDRYPLMTPYSPNLPPTIQDKSLFQVEGHPEVYWHQNNKLYWVTDWNVINDMSGIPGWDSVNTLPVSEFDPAAYEQGPRFINIGAISDGLLIREQGQPEVYLVSGGEKHHIISAEVFLSMGYSFDDVIDVSTQIIQIFPTGNDIGIGSITVGQGAPTPAIEQLFKDAYERNGGVGELGDPDSDVHEAFGLYQVQNFPGVPGIHGGVLMYNSIQNNVSYIHGAIWERYYIFQDKAELGPVKEDEKDAAPSQQGTTGRYSKFENGTIHWISDETGENENDPNRGKSFVTYGDLDKLYTEMGGTYNNWLGFPVVDQEVRDGYGYCEFEGGYIEWDDTNGMYIAKPKQLSVQITSPNNNDMFSKSQTITYRAEVFGGTPDFKYIWIIDSNPNAHIEQKSERISEWSYPASLMDVGEHTVMLKVIDSSGNIVESESINFKVFDKLIAIIPIEFDDRLHGQEMTAESLKVKADYVVSYYQQQSYGKENIGYELFLDNQNDGWFKISEKYSDISRKQYKNYPPDISFSCSYSPCELPDENVIKPDWYVWFNSMEKAGLSIRIDEENKWESIKPDGYDVGMVVFPEFLENENPHTYGAPSGAAWVDAKLPYGAWAHELGHALYGFKDLANDKKISLDFVTGKVNDIHEWGLMSPGGRRNPPPPITLYQKVYARWIDFDRKSSEDFGTYSVRKINDHAILNEGVLTYHPGDGTYFIFEGRNPDDNVDPEKGLDLTSKLEKIEGIELYQVENTPIVDPSGNVGQKISILADPNALGGLTLFSNRVSMISGESRYINAKTKVTVLKENDDFKIKIEEKPIKNMKVIIIDSSISKSSSTTSSVASMPENSYLDVDLHATSQRGNIGMDYSTGEYVSEIEGAHTSGNFLGGGSEWISIPNNIDAKLFIILTPDLKEMLQNDDLLEVEITSRLILYDEIGNSKESVQIIFTVNSENVDGDLAISLPINITFLPPITTMNQYNLKDGSTLPIKFTARNSTTDGFIYDDTVNVTITNSTGHIITYFTNGTGTDSVRINPEEEQYIVNFHSKNYDLNVGETYAVTVTFGESDSLRGYDVTYFDLVERGKGKK